MRFKHALACARPADMSPQIQPMVLTPGHGSLPSGHSTQAYVIARVLQQLFDDAEQDAYDTLNSRLANRERHAQARREAKSLQGKALSEFLATMRAGRGNAVSSRLLALEVRRNLRTEQLMRQAARVAINRTVAGVHFPVDSTAGRVLGVTLAEYFIARCKGGRRIQARQFNGERFDGDQDFKPEERLDASHEHVVLLGRIRIEGSPLLSWLWDKAMAELDGTYTSQRIA
jgi:hypothetical protein